MGVTWPRLAGAAVAVSVGMAGLSPGLASASNRVSAGARVGVLVRATPGEEPAVEQVVIGLGGKVGRKIGILNGFSATINQGSMARLSAEPGVYSVTADAPMHLLGTSYDANTDRNSMYHIENQVGSRTMWRTTTGAGIDVALIDSGVAPVEGVKNPGQIINGPDLTEESQNAATANLDSFGHGTFMAGIIAGRDTGVDPATSQSDTGAYLGVAPGARIVSVKVADGRGRTDVSQVIAGIDWVVQHAHDPGMNIRVLNLSFGTDSTQSYELDPLAFATEVAWQAGIVVVVSAGNTGTTLGRLNMPAADPFVIAVGAAEMHSHSYNAVVPVWSSRGDGVRNPDLVAPGVHIQGLRVPGSYIDAVHGATGKIDSRFFRGSGTSQAAAVVSGSVAEMLQRFPDLTPDQVKGMFVGTAIPLGKGSIEAQGAGIINIKGAKGANVPTATQGFTQSTGTGSIIASRGRYQLSLPRHLTGERDVFGKPFDSAAIAAAEANGSTWSGGDWNGSTWSGSTWSGSTWSGSTWSDAMWEGSTWSGSTWSGSTWSGGTWDGSTWSGSTWSGSTWSGSTWSDAEWSGGGWE
jgi:serine protease AprX